jgi:hypothetical protein
VDIRILKTGANGEVELRWEVSFNERYGQARQLAYKLDTIVINRRIDDAGRPLPRMLRIGSLNEICAELGTVQQGGKSKRDLKRAFLQNASAFINAKFTYKGIDGTERQIEAALSRYSVIFTGEKLPDGRRADSVYVVFSDPFWEVLNNAPVRPLDRAYMKELPPAAQRFYEIVSRKIFAALKNDYPQAKLSYAEYCTFSAQLRHYERQPVQDQMAKVLRPHKKSGYITRVKYEPTIDAQNQPDWIMYFTPGPKAHAEFAVAHRTRKSKLSSADSIETGEQPKRFHSGTRERRTKHEPAQPPQSFDPHLITEFTGRGITENKAREVLANLKPGQDVLAQLELGDRHIAKNPGKITNPAGFYIHLVEQNTPLPEGFETNSRRKAREEEEQRREEERREQVDLETEYQWYCDEEITRYIDALDPAEFAAVREAKVQEMRGKYKALSQGMIDDFARMETRFDLRKRVSLMTLEEFTEKRKKGTDSFLKLVPDPQPADPDADEPIPVLVLSDRPAISPAATITSPPATPSPQEATIQVSPESRAPATHSEPVIELASEPPISEPGDDALEPHLV